MQRTELTLILLAAIALLLTLVIVVLLVQMKQRRRQLRHRDEIIAEEIAKIDALTDELRHKGIDIPERQVSETTKTLTI